MKKTAYLDKDFEHYDVAKQEERELRDAERLMKSPNKKLKKAGELKYSKITGQYDEIPHSNSPLCPPY